ncbi:MAG: hypothetical protein ACI8UO_001537 [Verrucomicrobiales bacterium]|jgi:hypothetical protein
MWTSGLRWKPRLISLTKLDWSTDFQVRLRRVRTSFATVSHEVRYTVVVAVIPSLPRDLSDDV